MATPTPEDIKELEERHEQTLLSLNSTRSLIEDLEDQARKLKDDIAEGNEQLKSIKEQRNSLVQEIIDLNTVVSERTKAAEQIRQEAADAGKLASQVKDTNRQELEVMENERASLVEEIANLHEYIDDTKAAAEVELAKLTEELDEKRDEIAELSEAVADFHETYEKLQNDIAEAVKTLELVKQRAKEDAELSLRRTNEAEQRVADLGVEAGNLTERKETLLSDIDSLETELVEKHGVLQKITAGIESFEKEKTELQTFHRHVLSKEEHVREMFEQIGKPYPEFK